jgi:secondary thiamine-phosphate synthase enzyme
MGELVPRMEPGFRHGEGNSDAHVKTSLFGPGLTLIIQGGEPVLGTWQGIFLAEWDGPRRRRVAVKFSS